ncbi:histidine--tRNA ligase [Thermus sp.]|uniref:histidine--tRNA ligase n=1 Tax=Thermus sp. TaxID=275 RepID=UPI002616628B|nr:histidine--tRNA ligase [Thermus sp.]MCX7850240.1 histidine--tRNA ligase [Thermus sp.]
MKLESVRGMRDILPEEAVLWQRLEGEIRALFALYGYKEIRPPVVEPAELFARGVGEATDIVHKEMYVFPDKKGQMLALRPEATASVVRAYIEHGLYAKGDLAKLYYLGPMFRYEKPQKGRQRQFHQYGVEALGSLDPALDAEVIDLAWHLMERVGLSREGLFLRLNSIGCREDRPAYREALRAHFSARREELCADCQRRLAENPLRILDCKEPQCQEAIAAAPKSLDYLCPSCRAHFEELLSLLGDLGLAYTLDPRLVRGIDYYTRTVFELCSRELGAQDALLGGGRYDDLVEVLGGPPTPGVGFAGGMERLVLVLSQRQPLDAAAPDLDAYVVPIGAEARRKALELLAQLRRRGVAADLDYLGRSLRKAMSVAARRARYALLLGPDELAQGRLTLKDLRTGQSSSLLLGEFLANPRAFLA